LFFGEHVETLPPLVLEGLLNFAPWTGDWLTWLSRSIKSVETAEGCASLRERLVNPARFDEACSVLQIAERLTAAGLDIGFDRPVLVEGAEKVPDLPVRDPATNVEFHCEISAQYSSAALVEQSRAVNGLIESLLFGSEDRVLFAGRLLRPIDESEIAGLAGRVRWELMEAERNPGMREISIEGTVLLGIASHAHIAEFDSWSRRHHCEIGNSAARTSLPRNFPAR
jgi:hypothetical protein